MTMQKVAIVTGASRGIGAGPLRPRAAQVSDVVDGILFLESSPYITGEILHIDGGQIAGRSEPL